MWGRLWLCMLNSMRANIEHVEDQVPAVTDIRLYHLPFETGSDSFWVMNELERMRRRPECQAAVMSSLHILLEDTLYVHSNDYNLVARCLNCTWSVLVAGCLNCTWSVLSVSLICDEIHLLRLQVVTRCTWCKELSASIQLNIHVKIISCQLVWDHSCSQHVSVLSHSTDTALLSDIHCMSTCHTLQSSEWCIWQCWPWISCSMFAMIV